MNRLLRPGDVAPEFDAVDAAGARWQSSDLRGRWVAIFFYPRDFSPVCTAQVCAFRDVLPRLKELGAVVLGVSGDDVESHRAFTQRHVLEYPLLSDTDGTLAKAFGVRRSLLGLIPGRRTVVIDPSWRVALIHRGLFSGPEHAAAALGAIEAAVGNSKRRTEGGDGR